MILEIAGYIIAVWLLTGLTGTFLGLWMERTGRDPSGDGSMGFFIMGWFWPYLVYLKITSPFRRKS